MNIKEVQRNIFLENTYVVFFVISLFLIAWLFYSERKRIKLLINTFVSNRSFTLDRNEQERSSKFNLVTRGLYFLNFSVLLFGFLKLNNVTLDLDESNLFFSVLGFVVAYYLVKRVLVGLLGVIFDFVELSKNNIYYNQIITSLLGLFLFPVALFVHYQEIISLGFVFKLLLFFFILLTLFKSFRLYQLSLAQSGLLIYQNILYICTLEILPLVVLIKLLIGKTA